LSESLARALGLVHHFLCEVAWVVGVFLQILEEDGENCRTVVIELGLHALIKYCDVLYLSVYIQPSDSLDEQDYWQTCDGCSGRVENYKPQIVHIVDAFTEHVNRLPSNKLWEGYYCQEENDLLDEHVEQSVVSFVVEKGVAVGESNRVNEFAVFTLF